MVKMKPKEEKADEKMVNKIRWTSCAISKQPLSAPLVSCDLGLLYNKEVIVRHLIEKTIPENFSHIKSLKDVFSVNFKENPNYKANQEKINEVVDDPEAESPFMCPITGILVGGKYKFSVIKGCGHVFSERALRECPTDTCLVCNKPYSKESIISLNPTDEEIKELKEKIKEKKKTSSNSKKDKKEKKRKSEDQVVESSDKKRKTGKEEEEVSISNANKSNISTIVAVKS